MHLSLMASWRQVVGKCGSLAFVTLHAPNLFILPQALTQESEGIMNQERSEWSSQKWAGPEETGNTEAESTEKF